LADTAEKYLKKGDRVYIDGRIEYRTWEDREGKTRYSTEITAREMIMLSPRGEGSAQEPASAAAVQPAAQSGEAGSYDDFPEALDEEDDDLPF
jgi:single-strand DNA-binding protein